MHVSDSCFYPFWWRNLIISFFGINQPFVLHVILKDKTGNEIGNMAMWFSFFYNYNVYSH